MGRRLTSKLYLSNQRVIWHWCPACTCLHQYRLDSASEIKQPDWPEMEDKHPGAPQWSFNGNLELPTLMPSMLIYAEHPDSSRPWEEWVAMKQRGEIDRIPYVRETRCHYHLINGNIVFCEDCPHEYRGMTVPLPDLPSHDTYGYPGE